MSEPVTEYLNKLAARMRCAADVLVPAPAPDDYDWMKRRDGIQPPDCATAPSGLRPDDRDDFGTPVFLPSAPRPELTRLAKQVAYGCRGVVDLDMEDWLCIVDETTYQAAHCLAKAGRVELPNLGLLEIVYGELGPHGRLTLAEEARP